MSYFSKFSQDIVVSTVNSSTTNLTSGSLFTGTIESTLNYAGIQVSLFMDQNATVYVEQSPDTTPTGPHWDISDSYNYYADQTFGITVQAISSYVRIRVQNTGSATTNYLRLQTVFCPIVEAVPRSLDSKGNLKVALQSVKDAYGFVVENTPAGEQRVVTPVRLVGSTFEGTTIDTNFWTVTNTNGGTTTQANAIVTLATNTTANGATVLHSVRRARSISSSTMSFRAYIQLSAGITNNKRRWGIAYGATMPTITDGAYFQLDGDTLSIVVLNNSSANTVSSGNFNGTLGKTFSPGTDIHTYEIYFTGFQVWFIIGDEILHSYISTTPAWAATLNHYIYMDNVNSGGIITNSTLQCAAANIKRFGTLSTQPISRYQSGITTALPGSGIICKYGPGNLQAMIISSFSSGSVITLYDGTTTGGIIIHSCTLTLGAQSNNQPFTIDFKGLPFYNGLFLVIATQNSNVTLIYE